MMALRLLFFTLAFFASVIEATPYNAETCVYDKIFRNYNRKVRPVHLPNETVHVDFAFVFRSLGGIDERDEVLDTVGYLRMEWFDFQLEWDPEDCNDTTIIKVPAMDLWVPEFILSNSVDQFHQYTYKRDFGAWIRHDGQVHWAHGGLFRTVCELNLKAYPFDEHNCSIIIESWLFNSTEMELDTISATHDTQTTEKDTQWELMAMTANYYEVAAGWPSARVTFLWKRKVVYHVFNIICPTVFILVVALGVFWLPADCGEKVSLSITVLLAFSVIQLLIMDMLPPSSENIPNISLLVVGVMTLSTISVLTSMAVIYVSNKPSSTPVPRILRKVMYSRLSRFVFLKDELPFTEYKELEDTDTDTGTDQVITNKVNGINHINLNDMTVFESDDHSTNEDQFGARNGKLEEKLRILRGIQEHTKALVKSIEDQSKDDVIVTEWKTLAKLIDRLIFCLCLFTFIIFLFTFIGR